MQKVEELREIAGTTKKADAMGKSVDVEPQGAQRSPMQLLRMDNADVAKAS